MKILYYDNCWFTNVGEAFVDIGAMYIVRELFPNAHIANISNMSSYYVPTIKSKRIFKKQYAPCNYMLSDTIKYFDFDYLVLAGMFMSEAHLQGAVSKFVIEAAKVKRKIIFLGLGAEPNMNQDSVENFKQYLQSVQPVLVMTRDEKTYKFCLGGGYPLMQGMDTAFWVKNSYDPRGFASMDYDIVSYCRSKEPERFSNWSYPIIRPYHFQWHPTKEIFENNTFISDIPYDYITLYANAHKVYTDLVHATIISLQYGKEVEYFYTDNRADAFLDLPFIKKKDRMLRIDENELEDQKNKIVTGISKILQ